MEMVELTQSRLKMLLHYNQYTGEFRWRPAAIRARTKSSIKAFQLAGSSFNGYWKVGIDNREYRAHRLAFLYMLGYLPTLQIDHEDTNRSNNRWANLREVTNGQNQQNLRGAKRHSKSGLLGVTWYAPSQKWLARLTVDKVVHHLGYHIRQEDAVEAYREAKKRLHPFSNLQTISHTERN